MMEVEELFIGAYVRTPRDEVAKVIFLDICGNVILLTESGDSMPFLVKDIRPLIFTPRIFEMNGFADKTDKNISRYRLEQLGVKVIWVYQFHGEADNSWQIFNHSDATIYNTRKIQFVHELQRALIDCGCMDLAINFKVVEDGKI